MPAVQRLRWWVLLLIGTFFVPMIAHAQRIPSLTIIHTYEADNAILNVHFRNLEQGRVGLISLEGGTISEAQISAFGQNTTAFAAEGIYYAFISVPLDQAIRTYEAQAQIEYTDGEEETITFPLNVISGGFIQQPVSLPGADETLFNPETEANELAYIFEVADPVTPDALWGETGFVAPTDREFTSPFGAVRVFNDTYNTLHTGWDYGASIGESMTALASGRVAFAGPLPIRGNYVLIDHGWGLYTGYAHLSVTFVTQGQMIAPGQIIGRVGSTGRSSSAHAHIEMIANGNWVDVADFLALYLPDRDAEATATPEDE
ncbi:M23 family metallopeptidase [Phototrophicus methaneseepsis]|uniref:M23 family metallopeptidase n=1 Tax=Phototrophicus methaneseepsis TaxID=2710758 RepID=A0A7S8E6U7_9CHLR|nr:M23 family metallopeptidase [Phototrophicus methaneseepsis]QPC81383.1 M23 family metallopeptidase [Phototrophicus methaneseepsis]